MGEWDDMLGRGEYADDRLSDSITKLTNERNEAQAKVQQLEAELEELRHRVAEAEQGFPLGPWWVPDEHRPDPRLRRS